MFTRKQLELLSSLLAGEEIGEQERVALTRAVESAMWSSTKDLSPKDWQLVSQAKREGKTQVVGKGVSGLEPEQAAGGFASMRPTRMKPQAVAAKSGEELLAHLGIPLRSAG